MVEGRDNWYRDDWFNKQEEWNRTQPMLDDFSNNSRYRDPYRYKNEADDRYITRLRSPSPERPKWTNRDMMAYQNRSNIIM